MLLSWWCCAVGVSFSSIYGDKNSLSVTFFDSFAVLNSFYSCLISFYKPNTQTFPVNQCLKCTKLSLFVFVFIGQIFLFKLNSEFSFCYNMLYERCRVLRQTLWNSNVAFWLGFVFNKTRNFQYKDVLKKKN